jgi:PTS system nitrogen regulatory IIA component
MKMNLKKLLGKENVFLDLKSSSKKDIIKEMIDRLVVSGKIKDREAALEAVLTREEKMSTGMENGIAIPHGKTDSVDQLITAVALKKEGVDFDSMDGQVSTIFIMTISPQSRSGPHIQFLAEVSKLLKEPEAREMLLAARTVEEVIRVFSRKEGKNC